MPSSWTKNQIATRATEIQGNTQNVAKAEYWLDAILREYALSYRLPELQKQHSAAIGDGTETIAYPSDYAFLLIDPRLRTVGKLVDSGGSASGLFLAGTGVRSGLDHSTTGKGAPVEVGDDRLNSRWILHPISNIAGTVYLEYQHVPATAATGETVWFADEMALMEAVLFMAERYERGSLVVVSAAAKEAAKALYLRSPARAQMWVMGSVGSDLDPRVFR